MYPRMDEFSYLSVLISVILGLAVTQILKGFRGILLSRTRIRIYWPVIAWAALLLLVCVQSWWAMLSCVTISHGPLPHLGRFAANDPDLHGGRIGFFRFVR